MMEPTIHLRQAKVGDIPAILEIEQECFQEDSFSREQFVYLICRSKGGGAYCHKDGNNLSLIHI